MRVLLDECLPRRLKRELPGHTIQTVPEAGWAGKHNGELLRLAETRFDVFITVDQNLPSQQNLKARHLAFLILIAPNNKFETLLPMMPKVAQELSSLKSADVIWFPNPPRSGPQGCRPGRRRRAVAGRRPRCFRRNGFGLGGGRRRNPPRSVCWSRPPTLPLCRTG